MFRNVGSPIHLDFEVRNILDQLVNAASTSFKWRIGLTGMIRTATMTNDGVGLYSVNITPDRGGMIFWKFATVTPDIVRNGRIYVERAEMDEIARDAYW